MLDLWPNYCKKVKFKILVWTLVRPKLEKLEYMSCQVLSLNDILLLLDPLNL